MEVKFYKYQGTGNDFILIDNRTEGFPTDNYGLIEKLCHRRFGIGADGLILVQNQESSDFEMLYYNADGRPGSMCGNGGRCTVAFAHFLGIIAGTTTFMAVDGVHEAKVIDPNYIELKMADVNKVEIGADYFFMDTGSPHYIQFVDAIQGIDVYEAGREIRYNETYREQGTNVNFVEQNAKGLVVATYERGVEDETLSCGTGVTASALALALKEDNLQEVPITTKGGDLKVRFQKIEQEGKVGFENIWLCGPAHQVFVGLVEI